MAAIPENIIVGLQDSTPLIPLQSDNSLLNEREEEKNIRSRKYTELVETYTNYVKDTAQFKKNKRNCAFIVFISSFVAIILCTTFLVIYIVFLKDSPSIGDYSAIIASMAALISTIIILPQKIIDFIFNQEEEKYIVEVIKNTQDFDK